MIGLEMYPIFSVIMPVYNAESTIENSIKSVVNQIYPHWELILIDDGSTDNSGNICNGYSHQDSRILTYHKSNGGVSSARNLGLSKAKGTWICFIDADDVVFNTWLSNFYDNIQDDCQMVCQGFQTSRQLSPKVQETKFGINFNTKQKEAVRLLLDSGLLGYTVIKCFRRDIIINNDLRFDENMKFKEDGMFVIEYMSLIQEVRSTDSIGYFYNVPEWLKKYDMGNMSPYIRHVRESLRSGNSDVFHYCVSECTNILYDSYIKDASTKKKNLCMMYEIIKEYSHQNIIVSDNKKFILIKLLYIMDPKMKNSSRFLSFLITIRNKLKCVLEHR